MKPPSSARWLFHKAGWAAGAMLAVATIFVACGSERPAGVDEGASSTGGPAGNFCGTPNEGCECDAPGQTAACGSVKRTGPDGYVTCSMGHRTCLAKKWGPCIGENEVETRANEPVPVSTNGVHTNALGPGATCPANWNPCDPYCKMFDDNPIGLVLEGGLEVTGDGGISISVGSSSGGSSSGGGLLTNPSGVSNCGGANNIIGPDCTMANQYTVCQQDFRCDPNTLKCLWNGSTGYFDPNAGGPDLTVGVPCGPGGNSTSNVPVCNRGSADVPIGTVIKLERTTNPSPPNGCVSIAAPQDRWTFMLADKLVPGACTSFVVPDNTNGNKYITVNSGNTPATEAAGRCANNTAAWKTDGSPNCAGCTVCNTQIHGKVYDPSATTGATGNNVTLSGVEVFEPGGTLKDFASIAMPTCDTCAGLRSPFQTSTVTDAKGEFTLNNVSPGTNIPIAVQSGRWRRMITIPSVTACVMNEYDTAARAGTFRMPKNHNDGFASKADIPKMALSMNDRDPLECLLKKIGIDDTVDMKRRVNAADTARIQLYHYNGMDTNPAAPSAVQLWDGTINIQQEYSAILMGCESEAMAGALTAAQKTRLGDFTKFGGRIFMTHLPSEALMRPAGSPFAGAATSFYNTDPANTPNSDPAKGWIKTGTPAQDIFRDWMVAQIPVPFYAPAGGKNFAKSDEPKREVAGVAGGGVEFIRGDNNNNFAGAATGDYTLSATWETPIGGAACGRVVYNGMHTSPGRVSGGVPTSSSKKFPTDCTNGAGLGEEEKALEYQIFQLTACALGGTTPPPPPPPPPPLVAVTFVRDYYAQCGPGERVVWGPIYWQSVIPPSTSIVFQAATADTLAALPNAPPPAAPATRVVGTANATVLSPSWDCDGCGVGAPKSVDYHLRNDAPPPNTPSKPYLRMFMTFNPTAVLPPTLLAWRQIYDCVPAE